ncbi:MAG: PEP-CTERM sorting domain-containing protein [Desulfobacteraceae bacterium]|nr:MAG: PEP-CTERM sorting domain-containing protein [Desulfobacteraceae bacterium]
MRKLLSLVTFVCLTLVVYTSNVLAINYDYSDATDYANNSTYHSNPSWQRLGSGWTSENAPYAANGDYDDGVSWSVNGGAYGHSDITEGDNVTFEFVMYKYMWGRHNYDYLKVWIDWDQDKSFDDGVSYENAWYFKSDPGDAGQTPTTSYAYGDGLAQIYKTFYYTINDIAVDPGDYWLRARVVCNADIGSKPSNFTPTGDFWQGEVEDWTFTVNSVPEPATMLLLGLGLVGLAGVRRKLKG